MDSKAEEFWVGTCCKDKKSYYIGYFFFFFFTFLINGVIYKLTPDGCCGGDNLSVRFAFGSSVCVIIGSISRCICICSPKIKDRNYDEINNNTIVWYNK